MTVWIISYNYYHYFRGDEVEVQELLEETDYCIHFSRDLSPRLVMLVLIDDLYQE